MVRSMSPSTADLPLVDQGACDGPRAAGTLGHVDGAIGGVGECGAARRQGVGVAGVSRLQEDRPMVGQAGSHRQRRVLLM